MANGKREKKLVIVVAMKIGFLNSVGDHNSREQDGSNQGTAGSLLGLVSIDDLSF